MILVLSHERDDHALEVLTRLQRRGHPAFLYDTSSYPSRCAISQLIAQHGSCNSLRLEGTPVDLSACRVAWWRRPQPPRLDPALDPEVATFAYSEVVEALAGLWGSLDAVWVNPPDRDERAHHKPIQLHAAVRAGLAVPRTMITNDPDAARRFVDETGVERTVYKTFLATEQHWRETRVLRDTELELLPLVRLAPVILQEYIPAVADLRITVFGETILAAAITPDPEGYQYDYRMDLDRAGYRSMTLPPSVRAGIMQLMADLGLVFGAIDMRLTADGRYVFLEVNPAGEWLFIEQRTDLGITDAFVDLLTALDRGNEPG